MSPGEVTARGNRDVGKVGFLGKGPWGKRHAWEVSHGKNSTGKTGLGKCPRGSEPAPQSKISGLSNYHEQAILHVRAMTNMTQ